VQGQPPPARELHVVSRSGGDLAPIDPTSERGRLALMAYVWPDQTERFDRLRGALDLAAQVPAEVRREPATATLARTDVQDGSWTVVWHSLMRMYLDAGQKAEMDAAIEAIGARAASTCKVRAPVARTTPTRCA